MSTREIISLQFGNYSNYVGAHFWNLQELSFDYTGTKKTEFNHDVLYRQGSTLKGDVTYTPRLLLADLKGSLNSLSTSGGLDQNYDQENFSWDNVERIEEPGAEKNEYLKDIDSQATTEDGAYSFENLKSWSDYLYPRFHSRTINIVKDYQHNNDSEKFEVFPSGRTVWNSEYGEIFAENIRKYVEECDSMQGFKVMFDSVDGFAGLALSCLEHLSDEYGKSIIAYPIIPSHFSDNKPKTQEERDQSNLKDSVRLLNIAHTLQELSEYANLYVPLCIGENGWRKPGDGRNFDFIDYNSEIYYHTSAILASAIDTLSLKYRLKNNMYTMSDVIADMTGYGRKMAAASLTFPFAMSEAHYVIDHLNKISGPFSTSITPRCNIGIDKIFQILTIRGVPESNLKAPENSREAREHRSFPAYSCENLKQIFGLYFHVTNLLSATDITIVDTPLEVKTPFPKFFSEHLGKYGSIKEDSRIETVECVPVMAGYHNGTFMSDMIEKLHRDASRIKFAKVHKFQNEGFEAAEWKESLDKLAEFKDFYDDELEL